MKFEEIDKLIGDLFGIKSQRGKELYDFILENNIQNILELGFAHGKSTLYMAAALDELGRGSIITMDLKSAKKREPNIKQLLRKTKLKKYITPVYGHYNWELMNLIEKNTQEDRCEPVFDFCFIDGGHTWYVTGFGFFLVEKLLKPKGWVLFDDLGYSIERDSTHSKEYKNKFTKIERKTAQVGKVFSLLVKQHPQFKKFKDDGWWGWAQKK